MEVEMKVNKVNGYDKYELESAVRTLKEAETIKADPKLMEAIQPYLKKELKGLDRLKSLYNQKLVDEGGMADDHDYGLEEGVMVMDQSGGKS